MAAIFISYKRENLQKVQPIVQGLRGAGLDVWWDQDIAPDAPWEQTIERELEAAKVVLVCWSQAAVASENVKAEARRARNQGKLIQIFVEQCEPPLFFGERQGVDLSNWSGHAGDNRYQTVLTAVRAILAGKRPPDGVGYAARKRTPWALLSAAFVFLSAILGFLSNLGGARDAVCELRPVHEACLQAGLIQPDAPSLAEQQQQLVESISGTWGRGDRDCSVTVTYEVSRGDDGAYRIHGVAENFDSTLQVTMIDPEAGLVSARETLPGPSGLREQFEYHPNGDVLDVKDQAGTSTPLARCGAP